MALEMERAPELGASGNVKQCSDKGVTKATELEIFKGTGDFKGRFARDAVRTRSSSSQLSTLSRRIKPSRWAGWSSALQAHSHASVSVKSISSRQCQTESREIHKCDCCQAF